MPDTNQATLQSGTPVLDGRKTLLIGLGSTGAKTCNQIIERLIWAYDSPHNVPWLRCLVIETAPVAADKPIRHFANFLHAAIGEEEYSGLIANPQLYQQQVAFSTWNIPSLTQDADSITYGADNTRILGRLALLFPSNFVSIRDAIIDELKALNKVDDEKATTAFGDVAEEQVQVSLSENIHVYVVGTLCGGTASGCFIDMGYMLRTLSGYNFKTTGIFLLPSAAEQNELYTGNTYAALVELNHFSTENTQYHQQFPHRRGQVTYAPQGTSPYQYLYLVQSSGASKKEYATLITATADYLYADIIGSSAAARDGDRTNISRFFTQRDFWGATQKYFTFGLSAIEFPYTKVMKACALRLTQHGFQELGGGRELMERQREVVMEKIPLVQRKELRERLLDNGGNRLDLSIAQVLRDASSKVQKADEAMGLTRRQIDAAFDGVDVLHHPNEIHPKLTARVVPKTIEENTEVVKQQLQASIKAAMRQFLTGDSDIFGLLTLESFLKSLADALTEAKGKPKGTSQDNTLTQLNMQVDEAEKNVIKCRRSCWARRSLNRHIGVFLEQCSKFYTHQLNSVSNPAMEEIYDEALNFVQATQRRLKDKQHGLQEEVKGIIASMGELYKRTDVPSGTTEDGWERVINGTELYEPPDPQTKTGTVEQEYWFCMREVKKQQKLTGKIEDIEVRLARQAVQTYVDNALEELLADPDQFSRFDQDKHRTMRRYDDNQLLEMTKTARRSFSALGQRSIVERLLDKGQDLPAILRNAAEKSIVFLEWQHGHPRYFHQEQKSYAYVFYNSKDARAASFHLQLTAAGILNGDQRRTMNVANQHQVLFLAEQGAFSLGTVGNLKDEEQSSWRENYENPPGLESLHSRGDIKEWITWARVDEEARVRLRAMFIAAVALEIIEFKSANDYRFYYKKKRSSDKGFVSLPRDLDQVGHLIKHHELEKDIELRILQWRNEKGAIAVVDRIDTYIEKESSGKFTEGEYILHADDVEAYLLDFIFNDQELEAIYHSPQFYEGEVEQSYRREEEHGPAAYFCPHCNRKLGYNVNALYVYKQDKGRRVRKRECSYCEKSL